MSVENFQSGGYSKSNKTHNSFISELNKVIFIEYLIWKDTSLSG